MGPRFKLVEFGRDGIGPAELRQREPLAGGERERGIAEAEVESF